MLRRPPSVQSIGTAAMAGTGSNGWGLSKPEDSQIDQIEDLQASLAAALARIEAFRLREKALTDEVSALRSQAYCPTGQQLQAPQQPAQDPLSRSSSASAAATLEKAKSQSVQGDPAGSGPSVTAGSNARQKPGGRSAVGDILSGSSILGSPLYVTSLLEGGEHAAALINQDGRRVNCSIVIGRDHIDFVELRARIINHEFVGICAARDTRSSTDSSLPASVLAQQAALAAAGGSSGHQQPGSQGGNQGEGGGGKGVWEIHVSDGHGKTRTVKFEANQTTRMALHRVAEKWLGHEAEDSAEAAAAAAKRDATGIAEPRHMNPGELNLRLVGETSQILTPLHVRALATVIPPLERMRDWGLSYSTRVHGISLATLYRRMASGMPTITVVKDTSGYVFGCYTPEPWRVAPRFYGSGETFVFQLEPHRLMWRWDSLAREKNDFFQYSTPDCLALGGDGHFAIHVDQELLQGSSGVCGTFGSPCLASKEDFRVLLLEVWQVIN